MTDQRTDQPDPWAVVMACTPTGLCVVYAAVDVDDARATDRRQHAEAIAALTAEREALQKQCNKLKNSAKKYREQISALHEDYQGRIKRSTRSKLRQALEALVDRVIHDDVVGHTANSPQMERACAVLARTAP